MKLELIKKMNATGATAQLYQIGSYQVSVMNYESGFRNITVNQDWNEKFIPAIYYNDGMFGSDEKSFTIQTTSYGALTPDEIKQVIEGYEQAIEVVAVLTKEFIEVSEEEAMLEELEAIRQRSEANGEIIYAMGNGKSITSTTSVRLVEDLKGMGYWVVSIFRNGYRVEF